MCFRKQNMYSSKLYIIYLQVFFLFCMLLFVFSYVIKDSENQPPLLETVMSGNANDYYRKSSISWNKNDYSKIQVSNIFLNINDYSEVQLILIFLN